MSEPLYGPFGICQFFHSGHPEHGDQIQPQSQRSQEVSDAHLIQQILRHIAVMDYEVHMSLLHIFTSVVLIFRVLGFMLLSLWLPHRVQITQRNRQSVRLYHAGMKTSQAPGAGHTA